MKLPGNRIRSDEHGGVDRSHRRVKSGTSRGKNIDRIDRQIYREKERVATSHIDLKEEEEMKLLLLLFRPDNNKSPPQQSRMSRLCRVCGSCGEGNFLNFLSFFFLFPECYTAAVAFAAQPFLTRCRTVFFFFFSFLIIITAVVHFQGLRQTHARDI